MVNTIVRNSSSLSVFIDHINQLKLFTFINTLFYKFVMLIISVLLANLIHMQAGIVLFVVHLYLWIFPLVYSINFFFCGIFHILYLTIELFVNTWFVPPLCTTNLRVAKILLNLLKRNKSFIIKYSSCLFFSSEGSNAVSHVE